ncbi:LAMI_0H10176g1_1 [Lachancea mirantina]|uniref:LAMI_0H10176g1_1 n=1 Tax=Lachancea mirantina TaxID=1230905 RepID=A0A1G4KGI3_9SACH|nr:LAMI_0H10176g1_1 [Lachancea mirantina]
MGTAEFGTAKYLSKQMKAKGLQKLRCYCQICGKQCRDENGYKSHCRSPSHMKRISQMTPKDVDKFTELFEKSFLKVLRLSHGEKKIEANKFYNEFIQDKDHIHMNATKFTSLTKFIVHLGNSGKIRIHGTGDGDGDSDDDSDSVNVEEGRVFISFIDNSFENLMRNERLDKVTQSEVSDQDVRNKLLQQQIKEGQNSVETDDNDKAEVPTVRVDKVAIKLPKAESKGKITKKKKNVFKTRE